MELRGIFCALSHHQQDQDGEAGLVQNELNMAALRTAVKLLDRLQLRPNDGTNTGDDSVHVVSRLFNKYSGALLQGLEICQLDIPVRCQPIDHCAVDLSL